MSYRRYLESGALRQMYELPEQAFDMLVTLLARICDDPYDPVFSAPTGVPRRRVDGPRHLRTAVNVHGRRQVGRA